MKQACYEFLYILCFFKCLDKVVLKVRPLTP